MLTSSFSLGQSIRIGSDRWSGSGLIDQVKPIYNLSSNHFLMLNMTVII